MIFQLRFVFHAIEFLHSSEINLEKSLKSLFRKILSLCIRSAKYPRIKQISTIGTKYQQMASARYFCFNHSFEES